MILLLKNKKQQNVLIFIGVSVLNNTLVDVFDFSFSLVSAIIISFKIQSNI